MLLVGAHHHVRPWQFVNRGSFCCILNSLEHSESMWCPVKNPTLGKALSRYGLPHGGCCKNAIEPRAKNKRFSCVRLERIDVFFSWQVIGTSELIVRPGLINVDFADVREIITNSGTALIGIGTGTGKVRHLYHTHQIKRNDFGKNMRGPAI